VDYRVPPELGGTLFHLYGAAYPVYRGFMMLVSVAMLAALYFTLTRTRIGLVIQAAISHPHMAEALGHDVPRVFMLVFGGGAALAGLAGVIGGNAFVTEPAMAQLVGSIIFVVVVIGGLGSLGGAFVASLIIGCLQTFAVALDWSLAGALAGVGISLDALPRLQEAAAITVAQAAPVLPYLLMVLVLVFRPRGLAGTRE
jgi:branched-chain amino acid transport system permease protein